MKKGWLLLLLFCSAAIVCNAQKIERVKMLGDYTYSRDGSRLSLGDMARIMAPNPEAYSYIKQARANNAGSVVFEIIGGALIGWPIGTAIAGGDPNWVLAGVGAGFVVISIPFTIGKNKNAKQAMDLYNAGLSSSTSYSWKFQANSNGVGLCFQF